MRLGVRVSGAFRLRFPDYSSLKPRSFDTLPEKWLSLLIQLLRARDLGAACRTLNQQHLAITKGETEPIDWFTFEFETTVSKEKVGRYAVAEFLEKITKLGSSITVKSGSATLIISDISD